MSVLTASPAKRLTAAGRVGISLPLDGLREAGTYVCNWSGHLLRIHDPEQDARRFSNAGRQNADAWTVTRLSADPHIPRPHAKRLARGFGLCTSF